jgi:type VI secretion system protein ImpF
LPSRTDERYQNLQASILDRLVDHEPEVSHEPVQYRLLSVGQVKAWVARDLENLLNTRRHILAPPPVYSEVNNSLLVFGLPDFTSQNPKNVAVRQQLRQEIERTIARFEPRLRNVTVHVETTADNDRSLRFRINGLLIVEPEAEPVTFDTYFDVNRSQYVISG